MLAVAVLALSAGAADLRFSAVPDLGVEPAAIFADHAVLRRAADTPVFGFAPSGAKNPWVNLYNSDGFPAEPFERDRALRAGRPAFKLRK